MMWWSYDVSIFWGTALLAGLTSQLLSALGIIISYFCSSCDIDVYRLNVSYVRRIANDARALLTVIAGLAAQPACQKLPPQLAKSNGLDWMYLKTAENSIQYASHV
jgi:hypothetical protein